MIDWLRKSLERLTSWWQGDIRVISAEGDTLPSIIPTGKMVHLRDNGLSWSVGFLCPCGCGDVIELLLLQSIDPHWKLTADNLSRPTLQPSVWKKDGCKSHFWLKKGRVIWVGDISCQKRGWPHLLQ